jgi:serine/threonine protein kinase
MSPEAARGAEVDLRSDIYSVGVILFDMLCGRPPFEAEEVQDVLSMHISQPPPLPRKIAPEREITEACELLVLKALAKDPRDRHQSMDEFREELQNCYGSVAYRRNAFSIPGARTLGPEARGRRLTDELSEWMHRDDDTDVAVVPMRVRAPLDDEATIESDVPPLMSPRDTLRDLAPLPQPGAQPGTQPGAQPGAHAGAQPGAGADNTTDRMTVLEDEGASLTPEEEERLTAAVDAALDDELDDD